MSGVQEEENDNEIMTSSPVTHIISTHQVGKTFKLYKKRVDRLKETFLPWVNNLHRPFQALTDVSFEVVRGETIGIIGRNGSGKSTLLQIICGIMQPSKGTIAVDGRISALLELGAGFNPEYSGRDNVYFNGSILGLSKEEITAKLPEIEAFADIGPFIDQPVKTYSSGMYVRLAFSVAINVEPDILIVDEALSVGDALFQSKCFAKFREFQEQGVTILFVTHSMDLVTRYCQKALMLNDGKAVAYGNAKEVVDIYNRTIVRCENSNGPTDSVSSEDAKEQIENLTGSTQQNDSEGVAFLRNEDENRYGNGQAEIIDVGIQSLNSVSQHTIVHGQRYRFWIKVRFQQDCQQPVYAYTIKDVKGFDISGTNTHYQEIDTGEVKAGQVVEVHFDQDMMLNSGSYLMSFGCAGFVDGTYTVFDRRYDLVTFEVVSDKQSVGMFDLGSHITVNLLDE